MGCTVRKRGKTTPERYDSRTTSSPSDRPEAALWGQKKNKTLIEIRNIKSGDNKGTIRAGMEYLLVSTVARRHRLISRDYIKTLAVTAEAAGSSPVVPAILSKELTESAPF
jgi:hypothetical protein